MQTLPPTYINRRKIRELFEESYTFRQKQQKLQLSTPTQLFAEYTRMLDTDNGVLVCFKLNFFLLNTSILNICV
jgi:hypothetical protein